MARFLFKSLDFNAQIASMDSGGLRNAIPREGHFIISIENSKIDELIKSLEELKTDIINEFLPIEPNIQIEITKVDSQESVASFEETKT